MAKAKKQRITVDGSVVKIEYPTIRKSITVDTSEFDASIQVDARMHGFKQKYGDAESGGTPTEKYEMVQRIIEAHRAGQWDVGAAPRDNTAIIVEAVARIKAVTVEIVTAGLEKMTEEARVEKVKEWASNAKVKATVAKIRAERAEAAVDEDEDEVEL